MDKKNDQIFGFDYPDLDLSDEQHQKLENQPSDHPSKKTKIDQSIQKTNQAQIKLNVQEKRSNTPSVNEKTALPFFPPPPPGVANKGNNSWIPPPPVISKNVGNSHNGFRPPFQKPQFYNQNKDNKQKKNIVYVKNIPKSFNTQQKLMTFFKNQGVIKQIKVNEIEQSAVIKFLKEQNAAKFLKSNKIIFNRSYIVYGERENLNVTQQQINDRLNDQLGNVKKAQQTNLKVLKQRVSNNLSQQIRALYFLQNYIVSDEDQITKNLKQEIEKEIENKIAIKKVLQNQNDQKFKPQQFDQNQYNWSLILKRKSTTNLDKKSLYAQFLKYGPIINLEYETVSQENTQNQEKQNDKEENGSLSFDYKIKVNFLSLKSVWSIYHAKRQQISIEVQGKQISKYFDSGKLKIIQIKKESQAEIDAPPQKDLKKQSEVNQKIQMIQTVSVLQKDIQDEQIDEKMEQNVLKENSNA